MPQVKVSHEAKGKGESVYKKLKQYCDKKLILKELGNAKPNVEWDDDAMEGVFEEKGVKGTISVKTDSPCTITLVLDIPFFMLPFKSLLVTAVSRHLEKVA